MKIKTVFYSLILSTLFHQTPSFSQARHQPVRRSIKLTVDFPSASTQDTIAIYESFSLLKRLTDLSKSTFTFHQAIKGKDGLFHFKFQENGLKNHQICYIYAYLKQQVLPGESATLGAVGEKRFEMLPGYEFQAGDDLRMSVRIKKTLNPYHHYRYNFGYKFSGKGSMFQNLRYEIDSINYATSNDSMINRNNTYRPHNFEDVIIRKSLAMVKNDRSKLSEDEYNRAMAYAIFSCKTEEAMMLRVLDKGRVKQFSVSDKEKFIRAYDSVFLAFKSLLPAKILEDNPEYVAAEFGRTTLYAYFKSPKFFVDSIYQIVKENTKGLLRGQVLASHFSYYGKEIPLSSAQIEDYLSNAKASEYKSFLVDYMKSLVGQLAYNFELPNPAGKMVRLSDFRGKVVFVDFWYTGCGSCTAFYKDSLSKVEDTYLNDPDVVFITISIDKIKNNWIKSVNSRQYTNPEIINLYTAGNGFKSDVIQFYHIYSFPQPMLIGKDGRVKFSDLSLRSVNSLKANIEKEKLMN